MNPYQPQVQSNLAQTVQPAVPSAALQMAATMPQMDPTMAAGPSAYTAQMPVTPPDGMVMTSPGPLPAPSVVSQPAPQWTPQPGEVWSQPIPGATSAMPGQQPVQLGPPIPLSYADPAHVPAAGSTVPMVSAF
jgi:hypothetical protein